MLEPELLNDILGDANSLLQEKSRIGSFLSSASTADDGSFNSLYVYENNNVVSNTGVFYHLNISS